MSDSYREIETSNQFAQYLLEKSIPRLEQKMDNLAGEVASVNGQLKGMPDKAYCYKAAKLVMKDKIEHLPDDEKVEGEVTKQIKHHVDSMHTNKTPIEVKIPDELLEKKTFKARVINLENAKTVAISLAVFLGTLLSTQSCI